MHVNQISYEYDDLINILHIILKINYELSFEDTQFSFHVIIKGQNEELTLNNFCHNFWDVSSTLCQESSIPHSTRKSQDHI